MLRARHNNHAEGEVLIEVLLALLILGAVALPISRELVMLERTLQVRNEKIRSSEDLHGITSLSGVGERCSSVAASPLPARLVCERSTDERTAARVFFINRP